MHLLLLFPFLLWLSGSSGAREPISGPGTKRGPERGNLSVRCHYDKGWETYKKYWCRGAAWSHCEILIITTGSEQEVRQGRVTIRDHHRNRTFTVTMEQLREDDADIYWCGMERVGTDPGVQVKVIVDPAPTFQREVYSFPTMSSHSRDGSPTLKLSVLLPLVFAVLLLLFVGVTLLAWRMMKQQKKASGPNPEQTLESDLCYANLTLHQTGSSASSSQKKAPRRLSSAQDGQEDMDYITMPASSEGPSCPSRDVALPLSLSNLCPRRFQAPCPSEEISYTSLSQHVLDQEPTYSNTSHIPIRVHHEATEYSIIKKP
ncbi:CMRF35-like molecule 1 isoform X4 [Ochotona curzoniae]|uniref:CMRF35-like molecule 1 isoform X4 n=1 Tax=Ochotona curzoniae TaxID=130825 RepID=UPI001B34D944|nr:CMRF35-like molecule 1 isoform X4 [Ochotona curzoniae]